MLFNDISAKLPSCFLNLLFKSSIVCISESQDVSYWGCNANSTREKTQVTVWDPFPGSQYSNAALNHNKVSIYCALLTPQWEKNLRSYLCASWGTWSLKCSIERLHRQNRKFALILIITEAKNAHFFKCKRTGFVHPRLRDFVKITLTQVSSQWQWL